VPLAQGAIDFALSGLTSLAEAMAVGSGLEEYVDGDAAELDANEPPQDATLEGPTVEALLERRA
jgi:hypothetical protein